MKLNEIMSNALLQILKVKKIAFAIFDDNFKLIHFSNNLSDVYCLDSIRLQTSFWEIFPEFIGSEEQVTQILKSADGTYTLERVNKLSDRGELVYCDLTLLPHAVQSNISMGLICLVADTTEATAIDQTLRQDRYEIELLRANLSRDSCHCWKGLIGESEPIVNVREFINRIAPVQNTTILLQGESGTGKNVVARAIHQRSDRANRPFVEVNCASLPDNLLESEMFGYEKGAFTDARSSKKGLIEEADGGILFLDEIGELPLSLQAKFLSFLETKTFRRIGMTKEIGVDVRIIAATNKDLKHAVDQQEFRSDLYYRIHVVTIDLPPLRNLGNDVLLLADHFTQIFSYDLKKKIQGLTQEAQKKLLSYHWPGNIRELKNVIERAVIFSDTSSINADELILAEEDKLQPNQFGSTANISTDGRTLDEIESKLLKDTLIQCSGNQSQAARQLGITLDTFRYRMKKYHIKV